MFEASEMFPCLAYSLALHSKIKSFPMLAFIWICCTLESWDRTPATNYVCIGLCPFLFYRIPLGYLYLKGILLESPSCLVRTGFANRTHEPCFKHVSRSKSRKELAQKLNKSIWFMKINVKNLTMLSDVQKHKNDT